MLIPLKLVRGQPLQQQLYDQLRALIATGRLQPGARMPSTRMLAEQFAISRITVILTYERLVAEGVLYTLPAAGTFVGALPCALGQCAQGAAGTAIGDPGRRDAGPVGLPDAELFPANRWRAALRHALDRVGPRPPEQSPAGALALRAAISGWLAATRGLNVAADQILILSGRRRALDMVAQLLRPSGRAAVLEAPCDPTVAAAYASAGARLVHVPVDGDGMRTARLPDEPAALVHVTSGHQTPLGGILTPPRRERLLRWAERADAIIVEEDQDADLRTDAAVVPPLAAGPGAPRVIYIGGLAATMAPWLQLAFIVLPPALVAQATASSRGLDEHAAWLEEAALAEFIEGGAFARHVHRARKTYAARRHALAEARLLHLPEVRLFGADTGLHQAWLLPEDHGQPAAFVDAARRAGLIAATIGPAPGASGVPLERLVLIDAARIDEARLDAALRALAVAVRPVRWPDGLEPMLGVAAD